VAVEPIETAAEIRPSWLTGVKTVGITAGASTPQWIIDEVIKRLKTLTKTSPKKSKSQP
jgi:4-hydroxy-3-methylbut-2-enyl diphosphate reductase